MSASRITCKDALTILVGGPDESTRDEVARARVHVDRCPRCSNAYAAGLSPAAVHLFRARGPQPPAALRVALSLVAVTQLVIAIPWLVGKSLLPDPDVAVSHLTRDGALGLVIAAVALVTVWRPRYVYATTLIGLLVLGLQVVAGLADYQTKSVTASFEIVHVPVVLIVLGLFGVAASMAGRATPRGAPRPPVRPSRVSLVRDAQGSASSDDC